MFIWFSQLVTGIFFWMAFPSAFLCHFQDWKKFTFYLLFPFPVYHLSKILRKELLCKSRSYQWVILSPVYTEVKVISIPVISTSYSIATKQQFHNDAILQQVFKVRTRKRLTLVRLNIESLLEIAFYYQNFIIKLEWFLKLQREI